VKIAVSQRVVIDEKTGERRDALDQRWAMFLREAGYLPVPIPNCANLVRPLLDKIGVTGILLTGGNDLASLGGTAPERDEAEAALLGYARAFDVPLLGVCRGMQMIQAMCGVALQRVDGHVAPKQVIEFEGERILVNSYHNFGTHESSPGLAVCGRADDGIVKAVRSERGRMLGIMWHPERIEPARRNDMLLFQEFFGGQT
jgi:putative glutamine amidotransferase